MKRVYEACDKEDGLRVLVERLWPRGLTREKAAIDHWFKTLSPSPELRQWYNHIPERWPEFRRRYLSELAAAAPEEIGALAALCSEQPVTFVFAARDKDRNSAVVLSAYILKRISEL